MMSKPEHQELSSLNIVEDKKAQLRQTFPEVFREDQIDFDALKRALGEWIDPSKERFGLNWPGKAACSKLIQQASVGTLLPMREQSVDFDSTENLIIEGDNLEVLKLLQKSYYGKVKMIYIDPPYNTGNEFIYPDNFHDGKAAYLKESGQTDDMGLKQVSNAESNGRYHSNWLSMMYPRLFLARNLLREDGVIFVSIDDNEVHNLQALLNEIFGEENRLQNVVWRRHAGGGNDSKFFAVDHEYIVVYAKNKSGIEKLRMPLSAEDKAQYKDKDKHFEKLGPYKTKSFRRMRPDDPRPTLEYDIETPDKTILRDTWKWEKSKFLKALEHEKVILRKDRNDNWQVEYKIYLYEDIEESEDSEEKMKVPRSLLIEEQRNSEGKKQLREAIGADNVFSNPKPIGLLQTLMSYGMSSEDSILDFFGGSGTTAQAVFELNQEDNGNRKFILVQLPEPTDNPAYPTIADITRERVRRVSVKLKAAQAAPDLLSDTNNKAAPDLGFKAMRLSSSNFKVWDGRADQVADVGATLKLFAEHVLPGRTSEDILYELLLKTGFPLTTPLSSLTLAGKQVFRAAEGALLICLDHTLSLEVIEAMVALDPWLILCLDAGFSGQDQLKANAMQTVRAHNRNRQSSMSLKVV